MMVEQEGISDIKASVNVDIYRDTALRYLGKKYIHSKGIIIVERPLNLFTFSAALIISL